MNKEEQIKAQEFFSAGYIYPKVLNISGGKKEYYLSDNIHTVKINKEIYKFIKGLEL